MTLPTPTERLRLLASEFREMMRKDSKLSRVDFADFLVAHGVTFQEAAPPEQDGAWQEIVTLRNQLDRVRRHVQRAHAGLTYKAIGNASYDVKEPRQELEIALGEITVEVGEAAPREPSPTAVEAFLNTRGDTYLTIHADSHEAAVAWIIKGLRAAYAIDHPSREPEGT